MGVLNVRERLRIVKAKIKGGDLTALMKYKGTAEM
jgi:hypothetical protein